MLRRFSRAPSEIPVGLRLLIHQRFSEFLDALRAEGCTDSFRQWNASV